jgi:hypothetical protein
MFFLFSFSRQIFTSNQPSLFHFNRQKTLVLLRLSQHTVKFWKARFILCDIVWFYRFSTEMSVGWESKRKRTCETCGNFHFCLLSKEIRLLAIGKYDRRCLGTMELGENWTDQTRNIDVIVEKVNITFWLGVRAGRKYIFRAESFSYNASHEAFLWKF